HRAQVREALLHAADVIRIRAAGGMPHVAELARPAERALRAPADPDLRLELGERGEERVVERPELALERGFAPPERLHEPDRLVRPPAAPMEVHAHEAELVLVPAHADAE